MKGQQRGEKSTVNRQSPGRSHGSVDRFCREHISTKEDGDDLGDLGGKTPPTAPFPFVEVSARGNTYSTPCAKAPMITVDAIRSWVHVHTYEVDEQGPSRAPFGQPQRVSPQPRARPPLPYGVSRDCAGSFHAARLLAGSCVPERTLFKCGVYILLCVSIRAC